MKKLHLRTLLAVLILSVTLYSCRETADKAQ